MSDKTIFYPKEDWKIRLEYFEDKDYDLSYLMYVNVGKYEGHELYRAFEIYGITAEKGIEQGYGGADLYPDEHSDYIFLMPDISDKDEFNDISNRLWDENNEECKSLWLSTFAEGNKEALMEMFEKTLTKESKYINIYKNIKEEIAEEEAEREV